MIFVTVGQMLPFDRLVAAVDGWAATHASHEVFAQIGNGVYIPKRFPHVRRLTPFAFRERVRAASLVVSHAGMGTVITAMEEAKPIVVLPRRAAEKEATTEHQVHTARWLREKTSVFVADTETEVSLRIDEAIMSLDTVHAHIGRSASSALIERLQDYFLS